MRSVSAVEGGLEQNHHETTWHGNPFAGTRPCAIRHWGPLAFLPPSRNVKVSHFAHSPGSPSSD